MANKTIKSGREQIKMNIYINTNIEHIYKYSYLTETNSDTLCVVT